MPYRDDRDIDLTEVNFTRGMLAGLEQRVLLDAFSGYLSAVEGVVNDGKEATVYRCRPKPEVGNGYLAAKMYRARKFRSFGNDARYSILLGCATGGRRRPSNNAAVRDVAYPIGCGSIMNGMKWMRWQMPGCCSIETWKTSVVTFAARA